MRLNDSLGKDTWVFRIEEQVNPGQLDILGRAIPYTAELLSLIVVRVDQNRAPVATAVVVLAEALAWDGGERAVLLRAVGDPLLWQPAIILRVIEGLKREPVCGRWLRISVVNSLLNAK